METYTYPNASNQSQSTEASAHWEKELKPLNDMMCYFREYAKENPEVAALTCFGIGFIMGWKLKMW